MGSTPARLYVRNSVKSSGVDCISFHFCCASSRVLGSHFAARFAAFFWLFQSLSPRQHDPWLSREYGYTYALYSAGLMFMSANRSSSDISPLSTSALRSAMTFRISSSFRALREGVVQKGREACVICMRVSPEYANIKTCNCRCFRCNVCQSVAALQSQHGHLTFVLFAGPKKERIHLGAAIVAVVTIINADVPELLQLHMALARFWPPPGRSTTVGHHRAKRGPSELTIVGCHQVLELFCLGLFVFLTPSYDLKQHTKRARKT